MALYAACDLHSNNTVLAVVDEAGALRYRQRLPNDIGLLHGALAPFRDELAGVAVESTYNAYWLIDGLQAQGYPMRMVNTLAVPPIRHTQARRRRQRCQPPHGRADAAGVVADGMFLSARAASAA